jgi:hypothetical protein
MPAQEGGSCPTCGASVTVDVGPGREVQVGTVAAAVESLPRRRCAAGHEVPALDATAIETAVGQVRDAIPRARRRRLRGHDDCTRCGASLTMPARRTTWPVTLEALGGLDHLVTLHLDVPASRCPDCGTDHVPSRSHDDLDAAVREVLGEER